MPQSNPAYPIMLTARVTATDLARLRALSTRRGESTSLVVRSLIRDAAREVPEAALQEALQAVRPTPRWPDYDPLPAARRMHALRAKGLSHARIAAQLNADGVPTRTGRPWEPKAIWRFLTRYAG